MNKTLKVALHEYKRHVLRPRFWIALLAFPLGIVLIMFISAFLSFSAVDKNPIAYVDTGKVLKVQPDNSEKKGLFVFDIPLVAYQDEAAARQAVTEKQAQGYLVFPPDFMSSRTLTYYSDKPLSEDAYEKIDRLIRKNEVFGLDAEFIKRLDSGSDFEMISLDGSRTADESSAAKIILPVVIGVVFVFIILMSASYLLQAMVEEKENRTMETMITSVAPSQLMTGKIAGNMSVGLTQMLVWILILGVAVVIFKERIPFLQSLDSIWTSLLTNAVIMLPSFVSISALMATLGVTVTDSQESQQFAGLIIMPVTVPFYFMALFMMNPNGILPKVLCYIPLTSSVSTALRMAFTNLPTWEIALIFVIQILFAVFSVWLAGKAFKAGMLQYSKRLKLKDILGKEAANG